MTVKPLIQLPMTAGGHVYVARTNWRARRDELARLFDEQGLPSVAEALREVGWAERRGREVDDGFCADATSLIATRALPLLRESVELEPLLAD